MTEYRLEACLCFGEDSNARKKFGVTDKKIKLSFRRGDDNAASAQDKAETLLCRIVAQEIVDYGLVGLGVCATLFVRSSPASKRWKIAKRWHSINELVVA